MNNTQLFFTKLNKRAKAPVRAHNTDAGIDLFFLADVADATTVLDPGARALFNTGISVALPPDTTGLIWDKSGLAVGAGLKVMGGVIDEGYRGEILVCLANTSDEAVFIHDGHKIAQLLVQPILYPQLKEVKELPAAKDNRGNDGFGSSGLI